MSHVHSDDDEGQDVRSPLSPAPTYEIDFGDTEYPLHQPHVPAPNTDVSDILEHVDGTKYEDRSRVLCVGLKYECKVFDSVDTVISYLKREYRERESTTKLRTEPVWIDIQAPQQDDFSKIQQFFAMHPLTTEDCAYDDTGEKWEEFEDYIYAVISVPVNFYAALEEAPDMTNLNVLVFPDYVLTIHAHPIQGLDLVLRRIATEFEMETAKMSRNLSSVFEHKYDLSRVRAIHHSSTTKTTFPCTDWILYAILDAIVDLYIPQVDAFVRETETLEELVFVFDKNDHSEVMQRLDVAKKNTIALRRILLPKQRLVHRLMSSELVSKATQIYSRDILDHISISIDRIETCKEGLNHIHSNYMMKVQIDVKKSAKRTIIFLSRMSMMVAVLMPSNLIAGLWGMNCWVPWRGTEDPSVFVGLIASMFVMSMLLLIYFRGALNFQRETYD